MSSRLRVQLEGALQVLAALLVVWFSLAASNVRPWNIPIGRHVRWAVLVEFALVAVAYAIVTRPRVRMLWFPLLLGGFVSLAFLSAAWSADGGLTLGRAATLATVLVAGGALALSASERPQVVEVVVVGVVAGVVAVALLSLFQVWNDYDRAVVPATTQSPARYTGIGGNPNTTAMLIALVIPAVVWGLLSAPSRARRVVALLVFALLYGSLVATGSRGALLGALVGTLVFALAATRDRRKRMMVAVAAVALFGAGVVAIALPSPATTNPTIPFDIQPPSTPPLSRLDVQPKLPLESEVGFPRPGDEQFTRTLFTSSGRLDAWRGALDQALGRPVLGYGFGTEERVFVDRYYLHYSSVPENAYLGTLLQLGFVGLLVLLVLLGAILARTRSARSGLAAACAGAVACGLILAVGQSFLTSAGSPAMAPFWLFALLLVGATDTEVLRRLRDGERDEREVEPTQRDAEPRLDVMRRENERVRAQEHDDGARRGRRGRRRALSRRARARGAERRAR